MIGRLRREQLLTAAVQDVQVELAQLSDLDRAVLRAALERPASLRPPAHWAAARPPSRRRPRPAGADLARRARPVEPGVGAAPPSVRRGGPAPSATVDGDSTLLPVTDDTMLVRDPRAWALYQRTAAYVCETGWTPRHVRYVAFVPASVLQREVPRIIAIRDAVPFDAREHFRLTASGDELDLRLAQLIVDAQRFGIAGGVHQVYLLTAPGQPGHRRLAAPVEVHDVA